MIDLKLYGYTESEEPSDGLLPGRVTELRREHYTVVTERGDVTAMLKGSFYHHSKARGDFPCVGDFVLLNLLPCGASKQTKKNGGLRK